MPIFRWKINGNRLSDASTSWLEIFKWNKTLKSYNIISQMLMKKKLIHIDNEESQLFFPRSVHEYIFFPHTKKKKMNLFFHIFTLPLRKKSHSSFAIEFHGSQIGIEPCVRSMHLEEQHKFKLYIVILRGSKEKNEQQRFPSRCVFRSKIRRSSISSRKMRCSPKIRHLHRMRSEVSMCQCTRNIYVLMWFRFGTQMFYLPFSLSLSLPRFLSR